MVTTSGRPSSSPLNDEYMCEMQGAMDLLVEVGGSGKGEHHQCSGPGTLETLLKLADGLGTA
jgi:hypothetical protein